MGMASFQTSATRRSVFAIVARVAGALVGIVVVLAAVALGYRAWRQHENAVALAIDTRRGVEQTMFVPLGGVEQWIQIRGDDRANPVILFIHGGPGSTESPVSSLLRPWEKYFTVVMWDQRDSGKTFAHDGAAREMSLDRVSKDGIELAQYLRQHLGQKRIIIVGHSWGTMVGLRMAVARPDLFSAFVGTGQVVSIAEKEPVLYTRTMAVLRAAKDTDGIRRLTAVGPPPYRSVDGIMVDRGLAEKYDIPSEQHVLQDMLPIALTAPGWSLWDLYQSLQASSSAEKATYDDDASYDARTYSLKFPLPFFIINGAEDHVTPTDLAKRYFDMVHAPQKKFVVLPGVGHSAVLTEPDVFLHVLVSDVRPAVMKQAD